MSRLIVALLIAFGFFYIYVNQEDVVDKVRTVLNLDKAINRVNETIIERQSAFDEAERRALEK